MLPTKKSASRIRPLLNRQKSPRQIANMKNKPAGKSTGENLKVAVKSLPPSPPVISRLVTSVAAHWLLPQAVSPQSKRFSSQQKLARPKRWLYATVVISKRQKILSARKSPYRLHLLRTTVF